MSKQRIFQSLQVTIYHSVLCVVGVLLFVGAFLLGLYWARTGVAYLLLSILSGAGLVLLVTVFWEGFACYTFFDDRVVVQTPLHKETILKNEVLFVEDLDMLLLLGDSITHLPAIRIYDCKARVQIEVNDKTKPFLKEVCKGLHHHGTQELSPKLFSVYNRRYILTVSTVLLLFAAASALVYVL